MCREITRKRPNNLECFARKDLGVYETPPQVSQDPSETIEMTSTMSVTTDVEDHLEYIFCWPWSVHGEAERSETWA